MAQALFSKLCITFYNDDNVFRFKMKSTCSFALHVLLDPLLPPERSTGSILKDFLLRKEFGSR
jgi:hypothetical protein